ncbi:hypothetical protein [Kineosporia succinea]|uniref:DNA-binding protein n=1 Tax=Kineosporia succinea TaxID=84632 RepID=A0ABT9NX01_9ACTN|nr:hypothetical protein [Kineosporia succinea]MDP9824947.1 hypothetical protein [Kineosporia succinea]
MFSDDQQARDALSGADLAPRPWQSPGQPPSDTDLVRYATWLAHSPDPDPAALGAGLRLLASARAEIDQCEAGLMFGARAAGMTWPQVAQALGLGSAQAAQQRFHRVLARLP